MRTYIINFIFLLLFLALEDTLSAETDFSVDNSVSSRLDRWLNYYGLNLSDFTDSLLAKSEKNIFYYFDYSVDPTNLYKDFFIFSGDSSKFIDLDSYSIALEKSASGQLSSIGREVDAEVALIDIIHKKRTRILFCGTECNPEEAFWINDSTIYILGFTKKSLKNFPTIWTYQIYQNRMQEIKSESSIDLTGKDYLAEKRLKVIKFKY